MTAITEPLISIKNISKTFNVSGGDVRVLNDISFDVSKGDMTAIMGPSGAGKSTLLHILGAIDRPTSGSLLYEGQDILSFRDDALSGFRNRNVGFVFQFHHLLPEFNALENAMLPGLISGIDRAGTRRKAEEILKDLGLSKRMHHKPGQLSGGEQQRVAVARALMLEPSVVLADEPTGNLDTKTGEELFELLLELNAKGITFIIVTHNDLLASRCERIIRMKDGMIV
jgi:lipoprotein-releasing system ATP-binding protein